MPAAICKAAVFWIRHIGQQELGVMDEGPASLQSLDARVRVAPNPWDQPLVEVIGDLLLVSRMGGVSGSANRPARA